MSKDKVQLRVSENERLKDAIPPSTRQQAKEIANRQLSLVA